MKLRHSYRSRLLKGLVLGLGVIALSAPSALAVTAEQFTGSPDAQDARSGTGVYGQDQSQQVVSPDAGDARSGIGVYSQRSTPRVVSPDATDARQHVGVFGSDTATFTTSQPPASTPTVDNGFDWSYILIGAGIGAALGLLSLALVRSRSRIRPAP